MQTINQELINEFLDKGNIFAVVGVSKEPEKYGNKVYFDLKRAGYSVYPINPNAYTVLGDRCYPRLRDLPVLPPLRSLRRRLKNAKTLGSKKYGCSQVLNPRKLLGFAERMA